MKTKPTPDFDWAMLEALGGPEKKNELSLGVGFTGQEMAVHYGVAVQHATKHIRGLLANGVIKRIGYRRDTYGRLSTAVYDLVETPQR